MAILHQGVVGKHGKNIRMSDIIWVFWLFRPESQVAFGLTCRQLTINLPWRHGHAGWLPHGKTAGWQSDCTGLGVSPWNLEEIWRVKSIWMEYEWIMVYWCLLCTGHWYFENLAADSCGPFDHLTLFDSVWHWAPWGQRPELREKHQRQKGVQLLGHGFSGQDQQISTDQQIFSDLHRSLEFHVDSHWITWHDMT